MGYTSDPFRIVKLDPTLKGNAVKDYFACNLRFL